VFKYRGKSEIKDIPVLIEPGRMKPITMNAIWLVLLWKMWMGGKGLGVERDRWCSDGGGILKRITPA
jgi:hypothetical protein